MLRLFFLFLHKTNIYRLGTYTNLSEAPPTHYVQLCTHAKLKDRTLSAPHVTSIYFQQPTKTPKHQKVNNKEK
jgi:hypothetical protein